MSGYHSKTSADKGNPEESVNLAPHMFSASIRQGGQGQVLLIGRPSRKLAKSFVNVPVTPELHARLLEHTVGSLAMGTAALLEWALDELETRGISIEARPNG